VHFKILPDRPGPEWGLALLTRIHCNVGCMATRVRLLTVTDLHLRKRLYDELRRAVDAYHPNVLALVGDFLDAIGGRKNQLTCAEAAEELASFEAPEVVLVRGNHEDTNWWTFLNAWISTGRRLLTLHGEIGLFGPAAVLGFPCDMGDDTAFSEGKPQLPFDPGVWLPKLVKRHGPLMRALWLMHEPPSGTILSSPNSVVAGSDEWTNAIVRFSPLVTISGHDHETPRRTGRWFDRLGSSVCINVGQAETGPLHFALVDAEFPSDAPTLPSKLNITAFPAKQSIQVLSDQKLLRRGNSAGSIK
jgi:Icc-related predicted phosphoesterase